MALLPPLTVGPLEVGPVAHGGHCVARHENRVIFVRHALPGERVRVQITDASHDRFWRGDAIEILEEHPERVPAPCPIARPGGCGGCDFQHVSLHEQRRLKAAVVAEQLRRLAGLEWSGEVESVGGDGVGADGGLRWRTRMRYHVDGSGRVGLLAHRSHEVLPVPPGGCPIAASGVAGVADESWRPGTQLHVAQSPDDLAVVEDGTLRRGPAVLGERAAGHAFDVAAAGFWQPHIAAADTLAAVVREGLRPEPGERAFDLYCGVGLFSAVLVESGCRVWGVESDGPAVQHAQRNVPTARFTRGRVEQTLRRLPGRTDLVVLDPPRSGAGRGVIEQTCRRRPRRIAYVACDPAALARDLAYATAAGYRSAVIRAFDLFPMTHHVECVAILEPH